MEFTCRLFDIKLIELFKVKFCTNYEKIIHTVPNLHALHTYTYTYTHTHTHTRATCYLCAMVIFRFSYSFFLLPNAAPVS